MIFFHSFRGTAVAKQHKLSMLLVISQYWWCAAVAIINILLDSCCISAIQLFLRFLFIIRVSALFAHLRSLSLSFSRHFFLETIPHWLDSSFVPGNCTWYRQNDQNVLKHKNKHRKPSNASKKTVRKIMHFFWFWFVYIIAE